MRIRKYLSGSGTPTNDERPVHFLVLLVVEEGEVFLGIGVDVGGLLEQHRTDEVVENLPQLSMALDVADVLLLDLVLDLGEVGLQLGVEVILLHRRRLHSAIIELA